MNYYQPLELIGKRTKKPTGKWQYTITNDGVTMPVGNCYDKKCKHNSAEEAMQCYVDYLLDVSLQLDLDTGDTYRPCKICSKLTNKVAQVGGVGNMYHLCEAHLTKEMVATLYTTKNVAYIASS